MLLNTTTTTTQTSKHNKLVVCPYIKLHCYKKHTNPVCQLIQIANDDDNVFQHVFIQSLYTNDTTDGIPTIRKHLGFQDTVSLDNFCKDVLSVNVTTTPFRLHKGILHMNQYRFANESVEERIKFWRFLNSLVHSANQDWKQNIGLYPSYECIIERLIVLEDPFNSHILLNPIRYSLSELPYLNGISSIIVNTFHNNQEHELYKYVDIKRGRQSRITVCHPVFCVLVSKYHNLYYYMFGKNVYGHALCCTPQCLRDKNWITFIKLYIAFKSHINHDVLQANKKNTKPKTELNTVFRKWVDNCKIDNRIDDNNSNSYIEFINILSRRPNSRLTTTTTITESNNNDDDA